MEKPVNKQDVGASVPVIAIVAALLAILIIAGGAYLYRHLSSEQAHRGIVIATGSPSGTYHAMGSALKRVLENGGTFSDIQLRSTDGSVENMQLIGSARPEVDLAFVQGDASPSTDARLVTSLYHEVLHILVTSSDAQDIQDIYDLQGKRVSLGTAGSGTRELSQRVLGHFGVTPAEDLLLSPTDAASALSKGTLDAIFVLSAVPSKLVQQLARQDAIRFLSLGDTQEVGDEAHALELVFPGINSDIIPRSTYVRLPREPIHTVSVTAMLVARKNLEEDLVRSVAAAIFENRTGATGLEGSNLLVARKIREHYDPSSTSLAYHPGATSYYQRQEPPFFVEYAEALSLGLTLLLGLYSVFIALREWMRRRMKNRVDAHLLEVERLAANVHTLDREQLLIQQAAMEELRRTVFSDLVAERLLADEAFIILQNHLRDELAAIEARIAETG